MTKEKLRVMRAEFDVMVVVKNEAFTTKGKVRKVVQPSLAKLLQFEAHKFIDALSPEEIINKSTIEWEDVEIEEGIQNERTSKRKA